MKLVKYAMMIGISLVSFNTYAAVNDSGLKVEWSYKGNNGPARWGTLSPDFALCAKGKQQSPINIPRKVAKTDNELSIHYEALPLTIVDSGPTELTIDKQKLLVDTGHGIQVNYHGSHKKEYIKYNGTTYYLTQFHFHTPSENQWHGRSFPLEIHFVNQSDDGKVAALGVFVTAGGSNQSLEEVISHMPTQKGKEETIPDIKIKPSDLIPQNSKYFAFMGSLTTPPCTEGFQWLVMKIPVTADTAQILELRKAMGGMNARPVQSLNSRTIISSERIAQ